jgi:hypothetical protein
MSRIRRIDLGEERGTTLAELVVGLATGMVVLVGLTTLIVVTLHSSARVSARVDATQRARIALTKVIDQLHSACIAPKASPVYEESTGTVLRFVHAPGAAVSPTPILTEITLTAEGTLVQSDFAWKAGVPPDWEFQEETGSTTTLMTGVSPLTTGGPIFTYWAYGTTGTLSSTPLPTPLNELDALRTLQVNVAFKVAPTAGTGEAATPAPIQDSATFRLTPPSFKKEVPSLPCV